MENINLAIDFGNGNTKLYSAHGPQEFLSQVAMNDGQQMVNTPGLRKAKQPMQITSEFGSFHVGPHAHDHGRPLENLDVDRFNGSPELRALLYGGFTQHQRKYGVFNTPLSITVGVTNEFLSGENADRNIESAKQWLRGTHVWEADGTSCRAEIVEVKIASQSTGCLFDYQLDDQGQFIPDRKSVFSGEIGIISIGFGTVELMAVRNRTAVQRFTAYANSGVRRLLEIGSGRRLYSLGELDIQLRAGQLEVRADLPVWEREIMGVVERTWGNAWKRFAAVLLVGGGSILLKDSLPYRFNGKAFVPDNPIIAIARGLYKLSLFQQARKRQA
jgi:hypothetical protein